MALSGELHVHVFCFDYYFPFKSLVVLCVTATFTTAMQWFRGWKLICEIRVAEAEVSEDASGGSSLADLLVVIQSSQQRHTSVSGLTRLLLQLVSAAGFHALHQFLQTWL